MLQNENPNQWMLSHIHSRWDNSIWKNEMSKLVELNCVYNFPLFLFSERKAYTYVVERKRKNIGQNGFSTPILYAYNEMLLHRF